MQTTIIPKICMPVFTVSAVDKENMLFVSYINFNF